MAPHNLAKSNDNNNQYMIEKTGGGRRRVNRQDPAKQKKPDNKQHALFSIDRVLSMASETLAHLFHVDPNIMHLPPAPVTPFRGGIKSVPRKNEQNGDDDDTKLESFEDGDLLGASNDHTSQHYDRRNAVRFSNRSSFSSSHTSVKSWEPEDYPDPWTNPILCGGAATASLTKEHDQDQKRYSTESQKMIRMPLFCDPDQVLDKETLVNVAVQLREFAETFSSTDANEGVDFGTGAEVDQPLNEDEESNYQNWEGDSKSSQDSLTTDADVSNRRLSTHHSDTYPQSQPLRKLKGPLSTEKRLYSDSVGGLFSPTVHRDKVAKKKETVKDYKMEVAIALVQKINLPAILRADSYFFYSDQDDMVNDAAQYFARYIHSTWSKRLAQEQQIDPPTNIVLIFISTLDRICYISSGTGVTSILPWWRLEHVVQDMKQDLRKGQTGNALSTAIKDLTELLLEGPPTFPDRVDDFFQRFGIILLFTIFTFLFATAGECRDRRKRIFFAERRSRLTAAEKEKAMSLQKEFRTHMCPICLEPFDLTPDKDSDTDINSLDKEKSSEKQKQKIKCFDGVPIIGTDDQPIKILRCGHIFDKTCWQMWVDSGHGNPWICPVCRQDIGRTKRGSTSQRNSAGEGGDEDGARGIDENPNQEQSSLFARIVANTPGPSMLLRPVIDYNSLQPRTQRGRTPFAPLSHPTLRRLHPILGLSAPPPYPIEGLSEHTPLFAQASTSSDGDDDV
eukprot:CAMPEP_0172305746 /NCGR_PEP_ID=MMETSP1058-20130122/6984_1 /TAXON_ID=83371 /ORGANISM="Detonula confervacea, Strain CCMP 353" /LENGTH=732 /DNA_ID=CAMNT_0013017445 /DNA_START=207 /DNA_END=2405 /DNA_ORIENTATION=+